MFLAAANAALADFYISPRILAAIEIIVKIDLKIVGSSECVYAEVSVSIRERGYLFRKDLKSGGSNVIWQLH